MFLIVPFHIPEQADVTLISDAQTLGGPLPSALPLAVAEEQELVQVGGVSRAVSGAVPDAGGGRFRVS